MTPIEGQWGTEIAPTDYVAHWCVNGHCVGVMVAHRVSQTGFLPPPTPLTPPRLTPSHSAVHPTHPLYYQY